MVLKITKSNIKNNKILLFAFGLYNWYKANNVGTNSTKPTAEDGEKALGQKSAEIFIKNINTSTNVIIVLNNIDILTTLLVFNPFLFSQMRSYVSVRCIDEL